MSIRDFTHERDYFICFCEGNIPKPISGYEFYTQGIHVPLPYYNEQHWNLIKVALGNIALAGDSLTFHEFKTQVSSYLGNSTRLDFGSLAALIDSDWLLSGRKLLNNLLPAIAQLALDLTKLIRRPIRLLKKQDNGSLTMSQMQASSLLANTFFCTFPEWKRNVNREDWAFNRINFHRLFRKRTFRSCEKLKCILHYFNEVIRRPPNGVISFVRQNVPANVLDWASLEKPLTKLTVFPDGKIEDSGDHLTHMDFANKYIGGGVLGHGCVQEEILFLICPELIVSCLVCEVMDDNEAILLIGAERYSNYIGYGGTFHWKYRRKNNESPSKDMMNRLKTEVLAIDALYFECDKRYEQFLEKNIRRELLKAYAGFSLQTDISPIMIATGNWGCGAFNGDLHLKSLIQIIAVSAVGRPLCYFTFGGGIFAEELDEVVRLLYEKDLNIGDIYSMVVNYGTAMIEDVGRQREEENRNLFRWLRDRL